MSDDLLKRIASLSPEKRALLEQRLKSKTDKPQSNSFVIKRHDYGERVPLSMAQQRMWFLYELQPTSAFYNTSSIWQLMGKLDTVALRTAINQVIARHESLRTIFVMDNDSPLQAIMPALVLELPIVDVTGQSESQLQQRINAQVQQPFDLETGPMISASLYRQAEDKHVLQINMHHIITDGWSMGILFQELAQCYGAALNKTAVPLPELKIQYADYTLWQREWLQGEVLDKQLAYWQQQLAGIPALLSLPSDRPRPTEQSFKGAFQSKILSPSLSESLSTLSQAHNATLFMTLLAAFQVLLHRYCREDDVVVGVPIAGRNHTEIEPLIGYFINTLVLRTDLSGEPDFITLLSRVREMTLGAYAHQDLPFEKLVEVLQPQRSQSYSPLFQVMFVLQNNAEQSLSLPGLDVASLDTETKTAKFDLTLSMTESAEGLHAAIEYNIDLFDATTIDRMLGHLEILLEGIVAQPTQSIDKLSLLSTAERELILYEWNKTDKDLQISNTFYREFERQVEETPDHIAVVFKEEKLTYSQLNEKANQLANYLVSIGVKPKQPIVLCMDRSIDTMVAVLSIMKAGCYYVPMDPDYPQSRLYYIVDDVKADFILTQSLYKKKFHRNNLTTVCVDEISSQIGKEDTKNLLIEIKPDDLIYIIYTSGTTGNPKGVMIEHRSVLNLAFSYQINIFNALNKNDLRVGLNAPLVFDASVQQLNSLLYGHALYLVPDDVRHDIEDFIDFICTNRLNAIDFVPSHFQLMLDGGLLDKWNIDKSIVLIGGEAISERMWRQLVSNNEIIFYNTYGPTECTVDSARYHINGSTHGPVIGRPVANYKLFILDNDCNIVPIGMPGELHVGGIGVARGYLNRPELTKEKFISNPFSDDENDRLYKTGDLVRYLHDGNVEYLGRIDHQVKIRGYRIELGEIESNLEDHPAVKQALVNVYENDSDNKYLVAYIVKSEETREDNPDYAGFLKEKIPDYMVPVTYVHIDKIPLTSNDKVDRKSLPEPDFKITNLDQYQSAETETEKELAGIWEEILGVPKIGILDNFFNLGGHSLLATRMLSRIKNKTGIKLALKNLFLTPIIKDLAKIIDQSKSGGMSSNEPVIKKHQYENMRLPLSFAQQRLWVLYELQPTSAFYNIPGTWQLKGELDTVALRTAINQVIARHESLRTIFATDDDGPLQVIMPALVLELPIVDVTGQSESQLQQRISDQAQQPFNLETGPLISASLYRQAEDKHVLQIDMHHIISDGWSMGILFQELAQCYGAALNRTAVPLPELAIQYADYTLWQREWLQGEVLDKQLAYWQQQLAGVPALLSIPSDRPRPTKQSFKGAFQSKILSPSLSESLNTLSQTHNATLFMTLLAAFQVLLHRYCREDDIVVGVPIAGRNHTEIEPLIGFFINTLVLRTDLSGEPDFVTLLSRVREMTLGAYAHQDLPFEKLVEVLQPQRSRSYSPLFQVMFVLQNTAKQSLSLPGLDVVASLDTETKTAKFDLTLFMTESAEGLHAAIEYNIDLFDATTIERMLSHLEVLLEGIVAQPTQLIDKLPLLSAAEREQLLVSWNATATDYPRNQCIHELFSAQASRTPANTAVVYGKTSLSYTQLNNKANQLAHYLRAQGVGKGSLVALCLSRSPEMIITLLGILKAGAAYVPLDPEYPQQRLAFMLEDAQAKVLVTETSMLDQLPPQAGNRICLDREWEAIEQQGVHEPDNVNEALDIAYINYTSGSTGQPKGVMVPHRGVVRLSVNTDYVALQESDIIAQISNTSFDAATFEIWGALLAGARLMIIDKSTVLEPKTFVSVLRGQHISTLFLTTALFNLMAREKPDAFSTLKYVLFGGEAVDPPSVKKVMQSGPPQNLLHVYGPTENTTFSTWKKVINISDETHTIPIGRPVSNTTAYVLNNVLEPVPVGVAGELMLGGDGLATGYLNHDQLTQEKFINNPFVSAGDEKLYKTGDLVRYQPDGNIEFIDRLDYQVKIRGFRIELGEIEVILRQHESITDSVVLLRTDDEGEKQLVAFVVTEELTKNDVMEHLQQHLPQFSLPSDIILLETLPLTINGKVDRSALDNMTLDQHDELSTDEEEQSDSIEFKLKIIWQKILKNDAVKITDDFFQSGGHSLLGVHLLTEIEKTFDERLPLAALFEHRTIKGLAKVLRNRGWSLRWNSLVPIQPHGDNPGFFCVHGRSTDIVKYLDADQPFYWLHHAQHLQAVEGHSVEEIAQDHLKEIQIVQPHGPYYLGGFSFGGLLALEIARLLRQKGESIALMALFDPTVPKSKTASPSKISKAMTDLKARDNYSEKITSFMIKGVGYLQSKIKSLYNKSGDNFKRLQYRWYVSTNRAIPAELRVFELVQLFQIASSEYQQQTHYGDIDLFIPEGKGDIDARSSLLIQRWSEYVKGEVRIHVVKGAKTHHAIVEEPYVQNLTEQLNDCLKSSQGKIVE